MLSQSMHSYHGGGHGVVMREQVQQVPTSYTSSLLGNNSQLAQHNYDRYALGSSFNGLLPAGGSSYSAQPAYNLSASLSMSGIPTRASDNGQYI